MTTYSCKRLGNPDNPLIKWYIHIVDANSEANARRIMFNRGGDKDWFNPEKTMVWVATEFDP